MKNLKFVLSFIVLFAGVVTMVGCETALQAEELSYVTIDINPSVELIVSPNDKIVQANALNEDAEVLLSELDLIGMDLNDAVDLIIQTAIELGYISVDEDEQTFVEVSTISCDDALREKIHENVKEHINNAFEKRGLLGKSQEKTFDQVFIDEATSYGVTPEFLFLAYQVVELNDTYTLEQAVLLSEEAVFEIVKLAREQKQGLVLEVRNQFFQDRQELFDSYMPQIQSLEAQIVDVQTQIDALENGADATTLQATLDDLNIQLLALKETFHGEVAMLRESFKTQRNTFEELFKQEKQQRKEQHQEQVNQFNEETKERQNRMQDRIDAFQGNSDNKNGSSNKKS